MPRQGPMLQRVASVLAVASFGLMFLAGARLLLSGPVMQRVLANIPQPFENRDGDEEEPLFDEMEAEVEGSDEARPDGVELGASARANESVDDDGSVDGGQDDLRSASAPGIGTGVEPSGELEAATAPGLRIKKLRTSAESVLVGDIVEFEISVSNIGDIPLTEIGVADIFDTPYLAFIEAEPAPSRVDEVGGRIEWAGLGGGPLLPGERTVVVARFEAIKAAPAPYRPFNAARASAREQGLTDGPSIAVVNIEDPQIVCVGDQVFQDLINDGLFSAEDGDQGINGVSLSLYEDADGSASLTEADVEIAQTTSDADGRYAFCNLRAGNYLVAVDASNFEAGRPLALLASSRGGSLDASASDRAPDPNDDVDHDDNGAPLVASGAVVDAALSLDPRTVASRAIELEPGSEPGDDRDGDDENRNSTLDFGFALPRETQPELPESPDRVAPPVEEPEENSPPVETETETETETGITGGPDLRPGKPVHGKPSRNDDRRHRGDTQQLGIMSLQDRGCAHIVVAGESVDGIAWAHGLSPWSLAAHNRLVHPGLLRVGQVLDLCVPGP